MPISKKPRSKTDPKTSTKTSAAAALPDRRAMESFLAAIAGRRGDDATAKAQDVMYEAWERTTPHSRIALARKALGISPLCADAYVLLAEEAARSIKEARDYYAKGVEVGELALGPRRFKEYAGHFWGFLETRPYMRARAGLAGTLVQLGDVAGALAHYRDMLKLNPNDNQGIRYVLAGCLLRQDDDGRRSRRAATWREPFEAAGMALERFFPSIKRNTPAAALGCARPLEREKPPPDRTRFGPVLGVGKILVKTGPDISRKNLPPNRTLFFRSTARAQAGRSPRSISPG